jgi:hypothetical protein
VPCSIRKAARTMPQPENSSKNPISFIVGIEEELYREMS